ncbi:MAG TPA: histidine kinase [Streptosporangiaceae bacterium]|nr:histidine kinase [Streptosporangiaceae bacterium]
MSNQSLSAQVAGGVTAVGRGLVFFALTLTSLVLLAVPLLALTLTGWGFGFAIYAPSWESFDRRVFLFAVMLIAVLVVLPLLFLGILTMLRQLANLIRRLSGGWCGVPIAVPYKPVPVGLRRYRRLLRLLEDVATWRDLGWIVGSACVGTVLTAGPAVLIAFGLAGIGRTTHGDGLRNVILGSMLVTASVFAAPWLLRAYAALASSLLAPTGGAELARRVEHLAQTRSETIDTGAAEIRRIERDLHDGAQARLVAMGMTLDAAGHLIDEDPKAARALLIEARDNSAKALAELRALVRGILPPVLADRGVADAIRALALDTPLRTHLVSDLGGRPPAPVESAAYFAVSELLANVSKHAQAGQAWVDIRYTEGMLRIGVSDDGNGGADAAHGTGLQGIERRLAAFDGVLAISSPPGGPTAVTMEIPCALR